MISATYGVNLLNWLAVLSSLTLVDSLIPMMVATLSVYPFGSEDLAYECHFLITKCILSFLESKSLKVQHVAFDYALVDSCREHLSSRQLPPNLSELDILRWKCSGMEVSEQVPALQQEVDGVLSLHCC